MFTSKTPFLLIAIFSLIFMSCGEYEIPEGYKLVKIESNSTPPQLSDSTAIAWTSDWRSKMTDPTFLPSNPIQAFTIPHADINASLTSTNSRGYLGVDLSVAPPEYHLVIVGIDPSTGDDITSKIYDLTLPCPTTCDTSSFLYYSRKN